jgi:hypothetical protein
VKESTRDYLIALVFVIALIAFIHLVLRIPLCL